MAWQIQDVVELGKYVQFVKTDGFFLFLPGTATEAEILERVAANAQGWTPSHVKWDRGVLGVGSTLRIYGQVNTSTPSAVLAEQVATALNSFWGFTAVTLQVYTSNVIADPDPSGSEWAGPLQMIALAVIAVAIVYGIKQLKEISE